MFFVAGVDGTGDFDDAEYAKYFTSSYVKEMTSAALAPYGSFYRRGPTFDGATTGGRGKEVAEKVSEYLNAAKSGSQRPGVFLTGFSRGGAAVIHAAQILAERRIPVDALFLFDAVDRAIGVNAETIPRNVGSVHHAIRSNKASSRGTFSNTGTKYYSQYTRYNSKCRAIG